MASDRRHVQPADFSGFSQTPLTRRTVIAGAGLAIAAVGSRGLFGSLGTAVAETIDKPWKHTKDPRGIDIALTAGKQTEARFGFMFKDPPAYGPPDELLQQLAAQMGEPSGSALENPDILSGETFLGQFIDHDMTFDRTPMPEQELDPQGLVNFDSPSFDLASVYGRGPDLDPQFYESDGMHMRIVRTAEGLEDLPRLDDGTALIGDSRNDENLILTQLHLLFLKFHNRCLDTGLAKTLAQAQRLTRWHFQWVIINDFLKAVVGAELVSQILQGSPPKPKIDFYKPGDADRPMMPIEYAVAAFRFGHSMVRGRYTLNAAGSVPLFDPSLPDLRGGRPLPADLEIEWWRFFPVPGAPSSPRNPARLIDTKLAIPLLNLPPTVVKDPMVSLAQRNLVRGKRLGLPAGQDVAKMMKMKPLSSTELGLPDAGNPGWAGKAPLWFYILRDAEICQGGRRLGPLGAKLVAEVIVGILSCDKSSYIYDKTPFQPAPPIAPSGQFTMGEFAAFAQGT
jgi:hypothetical protein